MKNKLFTNLFLGLLTTGVFAQVGIGTTTPDPSAMLDVESTVAGVLIPRLTQAQRLAIGSPATGLLVYENDITIGFWYFDGTIWNTFGSSGWSLTGDTGTTPATNFLGTTDAQDLVIATNSVERVRIASDGNIGINETNPIAKLHITGTAPVFRLEDGSEALDRVLITDANGNASWNDPATVPFTDADWLFFGASKTISNPSYHTGGVVIGRTGTTTHHLDVDNGANTGTTIGIGDEEFLQDGNNQTRFSHMLTPRLDNDMSLGSSSFRWKTIFATNLAIQDNDFRMMSDIVPLTYGIESVMQLNPVTYKWKEEKYLKQPIPEAQKELKLGLIAQELQQIIPEVVYDYTWKQKSEQEQDVYVKLQNEFLGVNYEELLAVLVKAKQDQQNQLEMLQKETVALLNEIKNLKNN